LLGAPKESLFISISRNVKNGIHAEVLDLNISNLLPNSILSSPIFDFENLIPQNHDQSKKVRTENSYEEIIKRDEVRSFLKNVAQKLKK
jgi:hypothetical protein